MIYFVICESLTYMELALDLIEMADKIGFFETAFVSSFDRRPFGRPRIVTDLDSADSKLLSTFRDFATEMRLLRGNIY